MSDLVNYNFVYLDEQIKWMICCVILKVIVILGYQVLFVSCEMLMFYGWGIGGVQVMVVIFGQDDVFKVIDQGVDDMINVVFIWVFFQKIVDVVVIIYMGEVIIIQICYCILEYLLIEGQVIVYQVLIFELLCFLELCEIEMCKMYVFVEYGFMYVKFYEDIVCYGYIVKIYDYLVMIEGCYVMVLLLMFKFDNLKMYMLLVLQLFGVGCEKCIYVVLFYMDVVSFDFEDYLFEVQKFKQFCVLCGVCGVYLDEVVFDDCGGLMFVCFDIDYCEDCQVNGYFGYLVVNNEVVVKGVLK